MPAAAAAAVASPSPSASARKRGRAANNNNKASSSPSPTHSTASTTTTKRGRTTTTTTTTTTTEQQPAMAAAVAALAQLAPCKGKRKDGSACNRKAKGDCAHGRCVACCERHAQPCAAHEALIKKRKEEEDLLAQPIVGRGASGGDASDHFGDGALRVGPGDYREASFEVIGDTVVVFSLRDFLANKKWSKDALEQGLRRRRGRRGVGGSKTGGSSKPMGKRELGLALARARAERGRRKLAALYETAAAKAAEGNVEAE